MKNLAVLCSGFGSNLQAIINSLKKGSIKARIAVVLSDQVDAYALVRAKKAGLDIAVVQAADFPNRESYDKHVVKILRKYKVDYVLLAGFMRIISPYFVKSFNNRIINIHPSLLPSFKGVNGIGDALKYGVKTTGVTVHFVDKDLDAGPIIAQKAVEVKEEDTEDSLAERIHKVEHRLYPDAIKILVMGKLKIKGRKVLVKD